MSPKKGGLVWNKRSFKNVSWCNKFEDFVHIVKLNIFIDLVFYDASLEMKGYSSDELK